MRILSDTLTDDADFFVEDIVLLAIVFDNTDDATVWATTIVDGHECFFHLALPFKALDTLVLRAGERRAAMQEEVADALAAAEWPALLEYKSEDSLPVPLLRVVLKLSVTYPAPDPDADPSEELADEEELVPHNIFYLEGIYGRLDS